MINIRPDYLIVKTTRGHAREWFVACWINDYRSWPKESQHFSESDVLHAVYLMYDKGNQTATGFHKRGRQINPDKIYVSGVNTSSYPQIDWGLSYV